MDRTDIKILNALQGNAQLTAQELGDILALSPSQAGRRRQRLEADGRIRGYRADLDPSALGLAIQGFVQVSLETHGAAQSAGFARLVESCPEITSVWALTGDADYLLRVYCADLSALNRLVQDVLLAHPDVARVRSQIVLDQIKRDSPLPVAPSPGRN